MLALLVAVLSLFQSPAVILATTTSTQETGLLDSILPDFERRTGYRVQVVAVGSGQALALGRRGDADVVLSHAPEMEQAYVDSGFFTRRRRVMHNDFLIVGPHADPAGIRGMKDAAQALGRVAVRGGRAVFISRGDASGTHQRELQLWRRAGVTLPSPRPPLGQGWYAESGQGMSATLQIADQKAAYTLTDRATYLSWRDKVQLESLVEGDSALFNVYHVLDVNPRNAPRVNSAGGRALADYLLTPETQERIGQFGMARFGRSLFIPNSGTLHRVPE
jgi:tungstate transport system substrate-binding protein